MRQLVGLGLDSTGALASHQAVLPIAVASAPSPMFRKQDHRHCTSNMYNGSEIFEIAEERAAQRAARRNTGAGRGSGAGARPARLEIGMILSIKSTTSHMDHGVRL